jgi:hypothetical protein
MPFTGDPEYMGEELCPGDATNMHVWELWHTFTGVPDRRVPFGSHIADIDDPANVTALAALETFYDDAAQILVDALAATALDRKLDYGTINGIEFSPAPPHGETAATDLDFWGVHTILGDRWTEVKKITNIATEVGSDVVSGLVSAANSSQPTKTDLESAARIEYEKQPYAPETISTVQAVLVRDQEGYISTTPLISLVDPFIDLPSSAAPVRWPQSSVGSVQVGNAMVVTGVTTGLTAVDGATPAERYTLLFTPVIARLGEAVNVNLNVTTKTSIFAVEADHICFITHVVIRDASASLTTASFGLGFNANADDVVASATHTELTGSTLYTVLVAKAGAKLGVAADQFGLKCSIAQGSAATVDVEVFGYCIPA